MSEELEGQDADLAPVGFRMAPHTWAAVLGAQKRSRREQPRSAKMPSPCHLPAGGGPGGGWAGPPPGAGGGRPVRWDMPTAWHSDAARVMSRERATSRERARSPWKPTGPLRHADGSASAPLESVRWAPRARSPPAPASFPAVPRRGPAEGADAPGPLAQSRSEGRLAGALPLGAGGSERRPSSESLVSPLPRRKPAQLRGGPLDAAAPGPRGPALSPATSGTGTPPFGAASPTSLTGNSADSSPTASRGPRPWDAAACGAFAPRFLRSKGRGAPATLQALPGTPQRGAGEPAAGGADESPLAHADWSSVRRGEQDQEAAPLGPAARARTPPALGAAAEPAEGEGEGGGRRESAGESAVVSFALTMQEALNRYEGEYHAEPRRVQITFERFSTDDGEVHRDSLHSMLLHLGFLTSTASQAKQLASEMFRFASMDAADFAEFVSRFQQHERQAVHEAAAAWLAQEQKARTLAGLQNFLRSVGVVEDGAGVARMLHRGCPGKSPTNLELPDLLRVVAACRVNEGFTSHEVGAARESFEKLHVRFGVVCRGWSDIAVKVSALPTGMMSFFTIYSMRHFDELLRRLPPETERTQGVCFYEYLVWLRRLRDLDTKETWRIFHKADVEGSRRLSVARVGRLAELLGFTLVGDVVGELLGEVGVPDLSEGLDFGAVLRFVRACRARHGLSGREREEYLAAFQKFDTGNRCELTTSQVLNLLRHMGQTVRVDEVYGLIDMVDFNKNGTMDPDEFLTLMTLMREKEVAHAQKIFDSLRAGAPVLPKEQLAEALTLASEKPPLQAVLEEMLAKVTGPQTFDEFWGMVGACCARSRRVSRQRGDFSEQVFRQIEEIFAALGGPHASIKIGELIVMLSGSKFPVNTAPGRRDLLRRLEAARAQAVAAGVPEAELGPGDGEEVAFYTCVHLVRGIVREAEMAEMAREEEVLAQTRFTSDEAAEFRLVFMEIAQRGRGKRPSIGLGGLLDELTTQPAIGEHDMMNMLRTMGMRVSPNQLQELNSKIREATASGKRAGAEVDFVCFLRLIHWMLDTDYAGVNTAAAQASAAAPPAPKGAPRALDRSSRVQARALVKGAA